MHACLIRQNISPSMLVVGADASTTKWQRIQFSDEGVDIQRTSERGAAAVEFALLAPLLIMLMLGIMEFGRAYSTQITLSNAAREGVRVMAINNDEAAAVAAATRASSSLDPLTMEFTTSPTASTPAVCSPTRQVTLVVRYSLNTLTGIAGPFAMSGRGTMLCGG